MGKIIYIYSKYSKSCIEINDIAREINSINMLCIDNSQSRTRVLSNKEFDIQKVPTVIVDDDTIKIYEGENATNYILEVYNNINKKTEKASLIQENEDSNTSETHKETTSLIQENEYSNTSETEGTTSLIQEVLEDNNTSETEGTTSLIQENEEDSNKNDLMSIVDEFKKGREVLEVNKQKEGENQDNNKS